MQVFKFIDYFRLVAAVLVVAIHTSPLLSVNETADFVLTRILARVAVPFFFMASGFLLFGRKETLSNSNKDNKLVYSFLHKTLKLYLLTIILYLPLNIYMGYFKVDFSLVNLLKDLIFNGTIYHLWYLPAAVTGCLLTWVCMKKFGLKKAFIITIVLYMIGIFGDSYYKCISTSPIGYEFYNFLFRFFDYTRNGIFFAPIFFVMGALAGKQKYKLRIKLLRILFITSLSLMVVEGLLLHLYKIQRHDSMYFMLIPSMYFLFQLLLNSGENTDLDSKNTGKVINTKGFRTISLVVYIIHPLVIVGVRLLGKVTTDVVVTNSLVHFICVLTISIFIGIVINQLLIKRICRTSLSIQKRKDTGEVLK